jgi:hypothetical protein
MFVYLVYGVYDYEDRLILVTQDKNKADILARALEESDKYQSVRVDNVLMEMELVD